MTAPASSSPSSRAAVRIPRRRHGPDGAPEEAFRGVREPDGLVVDADPFSAAEDVTVDLLPRYYVALAQVRGNADRLALPPADPQRVVMTWSDGSLVVDKPDRADIAGALTDNGFTFDPDRDVLVLSGDDTAHQAASARAAGARLDELGIGVVLRHPQARPALGTASVAPPTPTVAARTEADDAPRRRTDLLRPGLRHHHPRPAYPLVVAIGGDPVRRASCRPPAVSTQPRAPAATTTVSCTTCRSSTSAMAPQPQPTPCFSPGTASISTLPEHPGRSRRRPAGGPPLPRPNRRACPCRRDRAGHRRRPGRDRRPGGGAAPAAGAVPDPHLGDVGRAPTRSRLDEGPADQLMETTSSLSNHARRITQIRNQAARHTRRPPLPERPSRLQPLGPAVCATAIAPTLGATLTWETVPTTKAPTSRSTARP
ncbi:hypothetical protein NKH18_48015 [Streptomyces sp. M10(2022)]